MADEPRRMGFHTKPTLKVVAPPLEEVEVNEEGPPEIDDSAELVLAPQVNPDPRIGHFFDMVVKGDYNPSISPTHILLESEMGTIIIEVGHTNDLHVLYRDPYTHQLTALFLGCHPEQQHGHEAHEAPVDKLRDGLKELVQAVGQPLHTREPDYYFD